MAELPEIKKMRRNIARNVIDRKITGFFVFNEKILKGDREFLAEKIVGSSFREIAVMGRILIFKVASGYFLFCNLYSNGEFILSEEQPNYARAVFEFDGGLKLYFVDKRVNGTLELLDDGQRKRRLVLLGIDPLAAEFTLNIFWKMLKNKRSSVLDFLKNQQYIGGIGDENAQIICNEARVDGARGIRELGNAEIKRLYRTMRKILKRKE